MENFNTGLRNWACRTIATIRPKSPRPWFSSPSSTSDWLKKRLICLQSAVSIAPPCLKIPLGSGEKYRSATQLGSWTLEQELLCYILAGTVCEQSCPSSMVGYIICSARILQARLSHSQKLLQSRLFSRLAILRGSITFLRWPENNETKEHH